MRGRRAVVEKGAAAQVLVEGVGLQLEVGDDDVEQAVAVVVAHVDPHAGLGPALVAERGAGEQRDVLEGAVALVVEEEVGLVVVGDVDVLPAVVVDVAEDHAEAGADGAGEARRAWVASSNVPSPRLRKKRTGRGL